MAARGKQMRILLPRAAGLNDGVNTEYRSQESGVSKSLITDFRPDVTMARCSKQILSTVSDES